MSSRTGLLAVIPARGGSKGLPGKNIRPLAGLPLIAHSILLAQMCPEIGRMLVSTDSLQIVEVVRDHCALFVGPYDLSFSLGVPGVFDHPEMRRGVEKDRRGRSGKERPSWYSHSLPGSPGSLN